jgi:hypothetical protein
MCVHLSTAGLKLTSFLLFSLYLHSQVVTFRSIVLEYLNCQEYHFLHQTLNVSFGQRPNKNMRVCAVRGL